MKNQDDTKLKEKKTADATTKMTQILEMSGKDFKVAMIKMLQPAIINIPKTDEKIEGIRIFQQRNKSHKGESNEHFWSGKYSN